VLETHDSAESGTITRRGSSVRKSIPLSSSLPDLTLHAEPDSRPAFWTPPQARSTAVASRSESMARMHSIKDAARDAAMEAALRNFEAKMAADSMQALGRDLGSAPAAWTAAVPLHSEVCSQFPDSRC